MEAIYLDNNATTRPAAAVVEAVNGALTAAWTNPSGAYPAAKEAARLLQSARADVAQLIGATPPEIVFTSGGTESIQSAIFGVAGAHPGKHFITTAVEHAATLEAAVGLESAGYKVTRLGVDQSGQLSLAKLAASIRPDTALVSVMSANNETGVLFPVEDIASICRKKRVLLHVDAVQSVGKIPVRASNCDLLSLSGHKIHGPKGVGALYTRRHLKLQPLLTGGHQEGDRRAGTENVPGIAGLGAAAQIARASLETELYEDVRTLRNEMEETILKAIPDARVNGLKSPRLPNTSSITILGTDARHLVSALGEAGFCISNGPACSSGSARPSHVLLAIGGIPGGRDLDHSRQPKLGEHQGADRPVYFCPALGNPRNAQKGV